MNEVIGLMKRHRSIRKFKDQTVEESVLKEIIDAGRCSATSSFLQAYSVIQVQNPVHRKKLVAYCGDQTHVEEAPVFLVFCADYYRLSKACEMQDAEMKKGYVEQLIIASVDAAIWGQSVLLAAESMGLGGVYVGGIRNHPREVSKMLKLPEQVYPVFGMSLGYPDQNPQLKPRMPLALVFKKDFYNEEQDKTLLEEYDQTILAYLRNRDSNAREETWTQTVSSKMSKESRPHMKEFLQEKGMNIK